MPITKACTRCGKLFKRKPSHIMKYKTNFCSRECKVQSQFGKPTWNKGKVGEYTLSSEHKKRIGESCKKIPAVRESWKRIQELCHTPEARAKAAQTLKQSGKVKGERNGMYGMTRDKNPNWKGGISYWRKTYYNSIPYKDWQKAVFKRDRYLCQLCGAQHKGGVILHAHHLQSFARFPLLRLAINNGLTLCRECHSKVHSKKLQIGIIKSIDKTNTAMNMYDLEVEDNHNYFANDILVHNSATPRREDGEDMRIRGALGEIIYQKSRKELIAEGYLANAIVHYYKPRFDMDLKFKRYADIYKEAIVENEDRNKLIIRLAIDAYVSKRKVLVLVSHIEHGQRLYNILSAGNASYPRIVFMNGNSKDRNRDMDQYDIIIATPIYDEGYDLPALDCVILAAGGRSSIKITQRIGRVLRPKPDGRSALIYDFLDSPKYLNKHSKRRREILEEEFEVIGKERTFV